MSAHAAAAVLSPVIRVLSAPVFLTVLLVDAVIRITGHFLPLPFTFPGPLTLLAATITLIFNLGVRAKMTSAMHALIQLAHGFPPGKTTDPDVVGEE
ncbi:MAG: hypothetical protein JRG77_08995 [Deltaproteobacteria bacterium]|nr:hypothetical protein [Deltaproteobacteria bacterium]MBW2098912.1 hypothetical protein [Deltaproteobacteria bacterium]